MMMMLVTRMRGVVREGARGVDSEEHCVNDDGELVRRRNGNVDKEDSDDDEILKNTFQ